MNKKATDNQINKINKRIETIVNKIGKESIMYKVFTDYFTVHGLKTRTKNGFIQLVRGKKGNVTSTHMNNIEMFDYYGKLKKELSKRGEKATKSNIVKAAYVKAKFGEVKEYIYLSSGHRYMNGLSGTKGKKTYAELYDILKSYEKEYELYEKAMYEELEDF